jgi:hypothetical protein
MGRLIVDFVVDALNLRFLKCLAKQLFLALFFREIVFPNASWFNENPELVSERSRRTLSLYA